jgi:hypothetical protein
MNPVLQGSALWRGSVMNPAIAGVCPVAGLPMNPAIAGVCPMAGLRDEQGYCRGLPYGTPPISVLRRFMPKGTARSGTLSVLLRPSGTASRLDEPGYCRGLPCGEPP